MKKYTDRNGRSFVIPVISFFSTKGRCRYCHNSLSIYYPIIEISTGIMFVLTYAFLVSKQIQNLNLLIITFFYLLFFNPSSLIINLLCGFGTFLFFVVISVGFSILTKKESMGGGDIKLVFLLGLFLGFPNMIISLYLAFLTGGLTGIILILWKKKSLKNASLPFGSFLVLGALVCLFWGNLILPKILPILGI